MKIGLCSVPYIYKCVEIQLDLYGTVHIIPGTNRDYPSLRHLKIGHAYRLFGGVYQVVGMEVPKC